MTIAAWSVTVRSFRSASLPGLNQVPRFLHATSRRGWCIWVQSLYHFVSIEFDVFWYCLLTLGLWFDDVSNFHGSNSAEHMAQRSKSRTIFCCSHAGSELFCMSDHRKYAEISRLNLMYPVQQYLPVDWGRSPSYPSELGIWGVRKSILSHGLMTWMICSFPHDLWTAKRFGHRNATHLSDPLVTGVQLRSYRYHLISWFKSLGGRPILVAMS